MLAEGENEFLLTAGKKLGYRRFDGKNEIIVFFNLENSPQQFLISGNGPFVDLLTGKPVTGNTISLDKLSAVVLKPAK